MKKQAFKLLIIEDEVHLNNILGDMFQILGVDVLQAFDGESGLEKLKLEQPDMVISDINLPRISGFEILKRSKDFVPPNRLTPFLFISAVDHSEEILAINDERCIGFLQKPFNHSELIEFVTTYKATLI